MPMPTKITLALSTCPNDTFLVHGLRSGATDPHGLEFGFVFADVQKLNEGLRAGRFDVSKASYALALTLAESVVALSVGSALGFGVGPLLLARPGLDANLAGPRVLCPGADTTATLLLRIFAPQLDHPEQVVFSEIMPALQAGRADLGVCIHEGRFTFRDAGLEMRQDLGAAWEADTGMPLPLGGLFARQELPGAVRNRVTAALRDSLEYGLAHREATLPTMTEFAQEMSSEVLFQHVDLYVNDWTLKLGKEGQAAIAALWDRAKRVDWPGCAPVPLASDI